MMSDDEIQGEEDAQGVPVYAEVDHFAWLKDAVNNPSDVRTAPGPTLVSAATDDEWGKVKLRDRDRISGRSSVPETMGAVVRAAKLMGTTPAAWFDAALGVTG